MPVSYMGTEGILNGLNEGDPFFNRLGATIAERALLRLGGLHGLHHDERRDRGCGSGARGALPLHRHLGLQRDLDEPAPVAVWAEAQRRGAKVVVIDPVRHRTAAHADWHIPIRPGTDGAVALAMMNVIIGEGLTDEGYVRAYAVGYDELAERVQGYTPEWAWEQTGIPPGTFGPWPGSTPLPSPR
jgi:Molybdopterin oxidoreductase